MHITSKGQVTIPQEIREKFGFLPHTEVEFEIQGEGVYLKKVTGSKDRGAKLIGHLKGRATVRMKTDEIMALTRGEE